MREIGLRVDFDTQAVSIDTYRPTVSVLWDRAVQQAVAAERTGPTIASRAYAMTHTAIYDAWAQFDPHALATTIGNTPPKRSLRMSLKSAKPPPLGLGLR